MRNAQEIQLVVHGTFNLFFLNLRLKVEADFMFLNE